MKLAHAPGRVIVAIGVFLVVGNILCAQEKPHVFKTPFSYELNMGGTTPVGRTTDGPYNSSVLFGGGLSLPVGKWFSVDLVSMDFGFGTTNNTQTISVNDGSTRKTHNYQMNFGSGARLNVPLGGKAVLGLGGGFGSIIQNEYVPIRVTNNGVATVIETVNCTSCSTASYNGAYVEARLFARSDKRTGFGVDAKYYLVTDPNASKYTFVNLPPQRWLSVGVKYTFGI